MNTHANVALIFPGQGSQYVGMGKKLVQNFKLARETMEEASDVISVSLLRLCQDGPESDLTLTFNAQPAILALSIAVWRVLRMEMALNPAVVAGHSLGEYSALVVSGALPFAQAVQLVRKRGEFMQEAISAGEGAMAAVIGLNAEQVEKVTRETREKLQREGRNLLVCAANYNSPSQVVISGHKEGVEIGAERLKSAGARRIIWLHVSAPFHCALMEKAAEALRPYLEQASWSILQIPYISNVDACWHRDEKGAKERLVLQMTHPVLWEQSVRTFREHAIDFCLELGPRDILSRLVRETLPEMRTAHLENVENLKETLSVVK